MTETILNDSKFNYNSMLTATTKIKKQKRQPELSLEVFFLWKKIYNSLIIKRIFRLFVEITKK